MKKRPSSARRSIPQQTFTPQLSLFRLRNFQSLLGKSDRNDGILIILGIDSRYNEGCREVANYLLFDFYNLRLRDLEESGIPEEDLDDLIIVIRQSAVAIYCSSVLYSYLLPYIAHWRNLEVFCWPDDNTGEENDCVSDSEEREKFKIESFVAMMEGIQNVGVPYWANRTIGLPNQLNAPEKFDKFVLEKWPIIQSYALEGVGGGSFFTMKFDVSNIRESLLPIIHRCDPASLEQILIRSLPLFERHWVDAMNCVLGPSGNGDAKSDVANPKTTEYDVIEPIRSYFYHGRISSHHLQQLGSGTSFSGTGVQPDCEPYVQFGSRTMETVTTSGLKEVTLKNSGVHGSGMHMVLHAIAPRSPLSCTRTYFISPDCSSEPSNKKDFKLLVQLYDVCVTACQSAVQDYCTNFSMEKSKKVARDSVVKNTALLPYKCEYEFGLKALDNSGNIMMIKENQMSPYIKLASMVISNIKSSDGKTHLGSVKYSDMFVDSSFNAIDDESGMVCKQNDFIILTSTIPVYKEWRSSMEKKELDDEVICRCKNVLLSAPPLLNSIKCCIDFFSNASFSVAPLNAPSFFVNVHSIQDFELYDNALPNSAVLLQISMRSQPGLPPYIEKIIQNQTKFAVIFYPKSHELKNFSTKVAPIFKNFVPSTTQPGFTELGRIDDQFESSFEDVQTQFNWYTRLSHRDQVNLRSSKLTKLTSGLQPKLTDFLNHFGVSSVLSGSQIPLSDVQVVLGGDNIPIKQDTTKVCITVVTGLPGSHAHKLSSSMASLHKERVRWVIIRARCLASNATVLDIQHLQGQLSDCVSKRKSSRPGAAATKRLRIVVEAIGFFDIASVVSCVVNHKDKNTRKNMVLGAVTVCVEPHCILMEHKHVLPKALEQCAAGLVNCVAFTGTLNDLKDKNLAEMQSLIRAVNPSAAFILAEDGQTSRTADFDLILSEQSFESEACKKTRHLMLPGLWNSNFETGNTSLQMQEMIIEFSQPLIKGSFSARLRALKNTLVGFPYSGNIYMARGLVAFTDCVDQEYDVSFVAKTGVMNLDPRPIQIQAKIPAPPPSKNSQVSKKFHLKFYGIGLDETNMKNWLRKSGRQKPSKKCLKRSLSVAEKNKIQEQHQMDPLPDGVFFNGTQYCSLLDNSRTYEHPNIQKFVEKYLEEENKKIILYNNNLEAQNFQDLFD